jgi:hypothetical protein
VSHDHVLLLRILNNLMHMWHYVTNHLIISNDKDFNSENRIKLRVRDMHCVLSVSEWFRYGSWITVIGTTKSAGSTTADASR